MSGSFPLKFLVRLKYIYIRVSENTSFEQYCIELKRNEYSVENTHHQVLLTLFLQTVATMKEKFYSSTAPRGLNLQPATDLLSDPVPQFS